MYPFKNLSNETIVTLLAELVSGIETQSKKKKRFLFYIKRKKESDSLGTWNKTNQILHNCRFKSSLASFNFSHMFKKLKTFHLLFFSFIFGFILNSDIFHWSGVWYGAELAENEKPFYPLSYLHLS